MLRNFVLKIILVVFVKQKIIIITCLLLLAYFIYIKSFSITKISKKGENDIPYLIR